MIKRGDIVRLRVPYPDSTSGLAVKTHMYVCVRDTGPGFVDCVSCQTYRPHIIASDIVKRYVDVEAKDSGDCFQIRTLIDCGKMFRITYDSEIEQCVTGHLPDSVLLLVDHSLANPDKDFAIYSYAWKEVKELL